MLRLGFAVFLLCCKHEAEGALTGLYVRHFWDFRGFGGTAAVDSIGASNSIWGAAVTRSVRGATFSDAAELFGGSGPLPQRLTLETGSTAGVSDLENMIGVEAMVYVTQFTQYARIFECGAGITGRDFIALSMNDGKPAFDVYYGAPSGQQSHVRVEAAPASSARAQSASNSPATAVAASASSIRTRSASVVAACSAEIADASSSRTHSGSKSTAAASTAACT